MKQNVFQKFLKYLIDLFNVQVSMEAAHQAYKNNSDLLIIVWGIDDIKSRALDILDLEIPDEVCIEIIYKLDKNHDCNYGITWETLDFYIYEYQAEVERLEMAA